MRQRQRQLGRHTATAYTSHHVTSSKVTLCGPGPDDTQYNTSHGALLRRGCTGTFSEQVIMGFNYGVSLRDTFGTQEAPSVVLTNSLFFGNFVNNIGLTHESNHFDPIEWFNFEGRNNLEPDPAPFTLADCQAAGGPHAAVTGQESAPSQKRTTGWTWVSWEMD